MNAIDLYIEDIENPLDRTALEGLRKTLHEFLPGAVECISYGIPTLKIHGKGIAGFAGYKNHLSFFPFSGTTLESFREELKDFTYTKSGVHFTPEKPIPKELIKRIVEKRLSE